MANVDTNAKKFYFVHTKKFFDSINKFSETDIIQLLEF